MIDRTMRALCMGALCLAMSALVGCSDDAETNDCVDISDCSLGSVCTAGKCVPRLDNFDCAIDLDCETGICENNVCVAGCRDDAGCGANQVCIGNQCKTAECESSTDCGPGERCVSRICVDVTQCTQVGQECDPQNIKNSEGFTCVDQGNGPVCALLCEERLFCENDLALKRVPACPQGSVCQGGACLPSNCDPLRVNADCDALAEANPVAFPNGANCQKTTVTIDTDGDGFATDDDLNYAYRCTATGTVARGAACGVSGGLGQPPSQCQAGLKCINSEYTDGLFAQGNSICQIPCTNDAQCPSGESCLGEEKAEFDGAGICGVRCDPYDVNPTACPDRQSCFPITSTDGRCIATNFTGEGNPYDGCDANTQARCPSGTICIASQCLPMCDPTLRNQPERNDTCAGGNPSAFVRVVHLAPLAGDVDVYVDGTRVADDLAFDAVAAGDGGWFELTPGTHTVEIVAAADQDNRRPILSESYNFAANTGTNVIALPRAGAVPVQLLASQDQRLVTPPTATQASIGLLHAVPGATDVDVFAVAANGDVSVANGRVQLGNDVAFGGRSNYLATTARVNDIYVFPANVPPTAAAAVAVFEDVTFAANQRASVVLHGDSAANIAYKLVQHAPFKHIPSSKGYCYDLGLNNDFRSLPSWGICFQQCEGGAADFGTGACDGPAGCSIFTSNTAVCLGDGGAVGVGGACGTGGGECADGLFCDLTSTGAGVCRSYCTVDGVVNSSLEGCQAGETCMPSQLINGLGECRIACQPQAPGDFRDTVRCPANQQTCYPDEGNFYCRPSGMLAEGADCRVCTVNGQPASGAACSGMLATDLDLSNSCAPGNLCVRELGFNPNSEVFEFGLTSFINAFTGVSGLDAAACHKVCRPFKAAGEASDCPADEACMPILPTQDLNTQAGVCYPKAQVTNEAEQLCNPEDGGKMCRDGSICQRSPEEPTDANGTMCTQQGSCLQFCDYTTQRGCLPGQRCVTNGGVGNRQLIFGVYGICQDEN